MSSPHSANRVDSNIAWTISRRLGMVIVLALAFFLSALITVYTLFRIGDTRVPDCIGRPEAEAQQMAEKAGLKVKIQRRNDATVPADTVIETRPGPNSSVKKDSNLTIVISSGPSQTRGRNRDKEPEQGQGARTETRSQNRGRLCQARDLLQASESKRGNYPLLLSLWSR